MSRIEHNYTMKPTEVGEILGVDQRTVRRYALGPSPKLTCIRTPGGHRRYDPDEVRRVFEKAQRP